MEDNTAGFSIGDVLDELGVNIPTSDEQIPDTGEVTEQSEAEVPEEAVADGADNTNENTEEIEKEPTEDADEESEDPEADGDEPEAEDRTVKNSIAVWINSLPERRRLRNALRPWSRNSLRPAMR